MNVITSHIEFSTAGKFDIVDITDHVHQNLGLTLFREGTVTVFNSSPGAGLMMGDCDTDSFIELKKSFETLIPAADKEDDDRENLNVPKAYLGVYRTLLTDSITVPFRQSKMLLGTLQKIVFIECDDRPRHRKIITQYIGI
jgi:thiamine phosphate synthase YjbQ (UPF0047 family)